MSEQQGAPAPIVTSPPAATPPPPLPAVTPPADPTWLPDRLARAEEQARLKVLEELGVKDPAKAKKLLEDAAKAEEDAKSQGQKLGETTKTLEQERAERERLAGVVKDHAGRQIATLTEAQQSAVRAIAPDTDPAAQLRAIDALKPTWSLPAPAATAPGATGAPPPPAPPAAGTAPPPTAPPQGGAVSPPDRKAEFARLKATNPQAAAAYLNRYGNEIYPRA